MPKRSHKRGKKQNADNAIAAESFTLRAQPDSPRRPRTRAWSKQEAERKRNEVGQAPEPPVLQVSRPERRTRRPQRSSAQQPSRRQVQGQDPDITVKRPEGNRDPSATKAVKPKKPKQSRKRTHAKAICPAPRPTDPTPGVKLRDGRGQFKKKVFLAEEQPELNQQPEVTATEEPRQRSESARPQTSTLDDWLRQVETVSPDLTQQAPALHPTLPPGFVQELDDSMDSSSGAGRSEDVESTAKQGGSKATTTLATKLRTRHVLKVVMPDEKLKYLKGILKTELPERRIKDMHDLQATVREFLEQLAAHPEDSCYPYIDEFSFNFDRCKSSIGYPVVNHKYFQADLKRCLARNEAVLQRTIMIHIINRHWLHEIFDWNTEGQWSLPKDNRLPSRTDDDISMPKPDLAVSFTLESFTTSEDGSDPIPKELERCICPDGGDRCFPFLFMEVKKAAADLLDAELANLHSASQALYNMYTWMVRAGQDKTFFDQVRVFSLVFNAQDLSVRVHRACQQSDGTLCFRFDELSPLERYTKDSACLLIDTILTNYAKGKLHPALKSAFVEVVKQEDSRVLNKRKANLVRNASMKKARRSQEGSGLRTGQSFAMDCLSTADAA